MKHLISFISKLLLILWCLAPMTAYAGPKADLEEAHTRLLAARACLAIYSDRTGTLSREYLKQEGWEIQPYIQAGDIDDARFLVAKRETGNDGQPLYLLAIVGTETLKNVKTNLTMDQVYFAGHTPEEFAANASLRRLPDSVPKVHHGFYKYVETAFKAKAPTKDNSNPRLLSELLLENKDRKVYLTGHSLGGATATLAGARLLSMGVKPEQIEVLTFGAPAVGNQAFAEKFAPSLHVTRVVIDGDPITGILQTVAGYKQFGQEIRWTSHDVTQKGNHAMVGYLDAAIKDYYDKRHKAQQDGLIELPMQKVTTGGVARTYISPARNLLPEGLRPEFEYMQQILWDEYRRVLPDYILADPAADVVTREQAAVQGCSWLIVPELSAHKLKTDPNTYYVTLQQMVYDTATGNLVNMSSFSTSTDNLTPLEALIHDVRGTNAETGKLLKKPE